MKVRSSVRVLQSKRFQVWSTCLKKFQVFSVNDTRKHFASWFARLQKTCPSCKERKNWFRRGVWSCSMIISKSSRKWKHRFSWKWTIRIWKALGDNTWLACRWTQVAGGWPGRIRSMMTLIWFHVRQCCRTQEILLSGSLHDFVSYSFLNLW